MLSRGNSQFDLWWTRHQYEFVSHATRHCEIFNDARLRCAEEVFRLNGVVEHEGGFGAERAVSSRFNENLGNAFHYFKYNALHGEEDQARYPNAYVVPDYAIESGVVNELTKDCQGQNHEFEIEDRNGYVIVHTTYNHVSYSDPTDYDCSVRMSDKKTSGKMYAFFSPSSEASNLFFRGQSKHISYLEDEENNRAVDKTLRHIYQDFLRDNASENHLSYFLSKFRKQVFGNDYHRLSSNIRVEKNGVRWFYGDIAVLIGNPRTHLSWEGLFSNKYSNNNEFRLREPFQVTSEEGFHTVSLKDPAVIIVGKSSAIDALNQQTNLDPEIKGRLVDINSLTTEQQTILRR